VTEPIITKITKADVANFLGFYLVHQKSRNKTGVTKHYLL
jgi:hypothetical protein